MSSDLGRETEQPRGASSRGEHGRLGAASGAGELLDPNAEFLLAASFELPGALTADAQLAPEIRECLVDIAERSRNDPRILSGL